MNMSFSEIIEYMGDNPASEWYKSCNQTTDY